MYVEKEKELMDAMRQNGFELFDGNSDDAYDTLERIFMAFVDYANCVIRMQVMVPIWRNRYEGEDLRDKRRLTIHAAFTMKQPSAALLN